MRETMINQSVLIPPMYLLCKDHKVIKPGELPSTRPVISGCKGMNLNLNDILSDILEPLTRAMDSDEVISAEDSLHLADSLNKEFHRRELNNSQKQAVLTATDAEALYPSLNAQETARVVREEVAKLQFNMNQFNWKELSRYLAMTTDYFQWRRWGVAEMIPTRRYTKGKRPGVTGEGPLGKEEDDEDKWVFPNMEPTDHQVKLLLAACLGVAVETVFTLHTYRFGGHIWQQLSGGPIGLRLTAVVARLRMARWMRELKETLGENGVEILLAGFYVDDVRMVTTVIPPGLRWDNSKRKLIFDQSWLLEDLESGQDPGERTSHLILGIMNTLTPDLRFTVELPSDFSSGRIPTLDTEWWISREGNSQKLLYSFFRKPMASPYCTLESSAWAWNNKASSLSQEVIRRMTNVSEDLPLEERLEVLREFIDLLTNSGYSRSQSRLILMAGLKGYEARRLRADQGGIPLHRSKHQTQQGRAVRKMMEKANWYKVTKRDQPRETEQTHSGPSTKRVQPRSNTVQPSTVMFVPRTPGGKLLSQLKEVEENISRVTKRKVRLLEETGSKMRELLCRSDPWEGEPCGRPKCATCSTEWGKQGACRTRSVVYENLCIPCREKKVVTRYVGETCRTLYERGKEHQSDALSSSKNSHWREHAKEHTDFEGPLTEMFSIQPIKTCRSALARQLREAIEIGRNPPTTLLLNSKEEFTRCLIPGITIEGYFKKDQPPTETQELVTPSSLEDMIQRDMRRKQDPDQSRRQKRPKLSKQVQDQNEPRESAHQTVQEEATPTPGNSKYHQLHRRPLKGRRRHEETAPATVQADQTHRVQDQDPVNQDKVVVGDGQAGQAEQADHVEPGAPEQAEQAEGAPEPYVGGDSDGQDHKTHGQGQVQGAAEAQEDVEGEPGVQEQTLSSQNPRQTKMANNFRQKLMKFRFENDGSEVLESSKLSDQDDVTHALERQDDVTQVNISIQDDVTHVQNDVTISDVTHRTEQVEVSKVSREQAKAQAEVSSIQVDVTHVQDQVTIPDVIDRREQVEVSREQGEASSIIVSETPTRKVNKLCSGYVTYRQTHISGNQSDTHKIVAKPNYRSRRRNTKKLAEPTGGNHLISNFFKPVNKGGNLLVVSAEIEDGMGADTLRGKAD